ncbi:transcription factor MYB3R-4 isoform X1 [Amborella trichopoda]|uniref:Uncharacterized protein n=1 Tax=Amborella trichopoda TaxID=13333 RepID=W1NSE3_AMBTC|nr:transcription factor MYB3R-4 isoform X1 [Amborella trichopoda]XP_020518259.1 transcription factor MYB3R-4 isoform X1 [Amborella trichopoda]ERM98598.1 hypothetical protein AMTR_s00109p00061950 [Amborella trichopoda]|eukprot:XP_006833320.1 transcription factor MYB3R-4 isoform X1 [Amborella trichopoda]
MAGDRTKRNATIESSRNQVTAPALSDGSSETANNLRLNSHGRTSGPTRRSTKGGWTPEEDEILRKAVHYYNGKNWKKIAAFFTDRTDVQCLHRWQKVLNPDLVKGPWSKEEDDMIIELVRQHGAKKWSTIAQALPGRIGKQCRERWHNHLNPAISKEAWTQQEELALIRAHQQYGNKWAELAKFLPGRTDNAIKNHWNSSLKKKLASYVASGLLGQFPGFSHVDPTTLCVPSSSSTWNQPTTGDESLKDAVGVDDMSECSQGSVSVGFFQSEPCGLADTSVQAIHHASELLNISDEANKKDATEYLASPCSEDYYIPALPEAESEVPEEVDGHEDGYSVGDACGMNSIEVSKTTLLERDEELSGPLKTSNIKDSVLSQCTDYFRSPTTPQRNISSPDKHENEVFMVPNNGIGSKFSETRGEHGGYRISDIIDLHGCMISYCGSANIGSSQMQNPRLDKGDVCCPIAPNDEFLKPHNETEAPAQIDTNMSNLVSEDNCRTHSRGIDENHRPHSEKLDSEALFYEPPRIPSWDLPFVNCDLVACGGDLQQAYSPLGIRQQMMFSSIECSTPYRLWDSPCDTSPDAVLKSAAKSFGSTPSILKKRPRDPSTPVLEMKRDNEPGRELNRGLFSTPYHDKCESSCLDENGACRSSFGGEGSHMPSPQYRLKKKPMASSKLNDTHFVRDLRDEGSSLDAQLDFCNSKNEVKQVTDKMANLETSDENRTMQPSGVLSAHNVNDIQLFSPTGDECPINRPLKGCTRTPRSHLRKHKEITLSQVDRKGRYDHAFESSCLSCFVSPSLCDRKHDPRISGQKGIPSNKEDVENISIFCNTPGIKRGIDSPSAWKSPWYIEDLDFFMSPGEKSYDAIGLMRELSGHTAAALAEAGEILANGNRDMCSSPAKENGPINQSHIKETTQYPDNELLNLIPLPDSALFCSEARVLDFSGCDTPGKASNTKENGVGGNNQWSSSINLSSPSSYLMKACR